MDAKCFILCADEYKPWPGPEGPVKQLIEVEGEVLLHRTVRLARQHTSDVMITALPEAEGFEVPGAVTHYEASLHLYHLVVKLMTDTDTVVLFGDCWYDEEAMAEFFQPRPTWTAYLRNWPSRLTGCPYGEVYAISFPPSCQEEFRRVVNYCRKLTKWGAARPYKCWQVIREMKGPAKVVIDSWVEDFDNEKDLENWKKGRCTRS